MKKQLILIMVDTQRTDMLACYGNDGMFTPNLDALAEQGVVYDRAYTCQPVCGPARSAIFTGLFPHSNGVWANNLALGDNVKTIGQRLTDNGIHAAYIGKWHLDGGDYFGLGRCPDGWDEKYWYDMRCYLEEMTEEDRYRSRQDDTEDIRASFTYANKCSNKAISFLEEYGDDDFFLVVSYDEPHGPSLSPEPFSSMYDNYRFPKKDNVWDDLENKPEHQRIWAGDAAAENKDELDITKRSLISCNSYVDGEIGRVLEQIKKKAPDAMILYTSDHGDMMRSHSLSEKGPAAYEEICHIPFIIKDNIHAGLRYPYPVSHIDIVPTILEYMGLPVPKLLEGKCLLPTLEDARQKINDNVFIEFGRYEIDHDGFGGFQPMRAVFDGRYKLVINLLSSDELYDLQSDPDELSNLINDDAYSGVRDALHDRLLDWQNDTRDPFRGYYWENRPWRKTARKPTWDYTGFTRQRENEEYEPRQLDYSTGLEMESAVRKKKDLPEYIRFDNGEKKL